MDDVTSGCRYRVAMRHPEPEHPNAGVAHFGPAFDDGYLGAAEQLGVTVDLLDAARQCADRCRDEHPDYEVFVVELVDNGDGTASWREVV